VNSIWRRASCALREHGVSCPDDVRVVGFDKVTDRQYYQPAFTTVRMDFREVGPKYVRRLLELVGGAERSPKIQPEVIVRCSAAPPPDLAE
jgi:DNA-binding LacI/PurR family transcriptional regulator